MHMYRVIQTGPRGLDSLVSLHGLVEDATEYAEMLNGLDEGNCFTYRAEDRPMEVTTSAIAYEEN